MNFLFENGLKFAEDFDEEFGVDITRSYAYWLIAQSVDFVGRDFAFTTKFLKEYGAAWAKDSKMERRTGKKLSLSFDSHEVYHPTENSLYYEICSYYESQSIIVIPISTGKFYCSLPEGTQSDIDAEDLAIWVKDNQDVFATDDEVRRERGKLKSEIIELDKSVETLLSSTHH